ncbi:hypothetical protein D9O40_18260 [Clostridium autoethanogenum]|uniref:TerB family tellurite resistance protein n=1 Tax=Clostridium autoethanogenum TaxID=84023 RepID=A0A3M0S361_9CLOT|nr:hypothetical protein [Clostridium autoethanogenum]RMC93022.1 hypothetical protein D9O40_18260 [Clostridium autoethanogenum]
MNIREILKTEESKLNFLGGLIRLAKIDGSVSEDEKIFFSQAAVQLEMKEKTISLLESYWSSEDKINVKFETKRESLFFIQQAVQLCAVDGVYSDKEKREIRLLGKELSLLESSIEKIETWVEDGLRWQALGETLLGIED